MAYDTCLAGIMFMGIADSTPKIGTPTLRRSRNFPTPEDPKRPVYRTDSTALLSPKMDLITPETYIISIGSTWDDIRHITRWGGGRKSFNSANRPRLGVHVQRTKIHVHSILRQLTNTHTHERYLHTVHMVPMRSLYGSIRTLPLSAAGKFRRTVDVPAMLKHAVPKFAR